VEKKGKAYVSDSTEKGNTSTILNTKVTSKQNRRKILHQAGVKVALGMLLQSRKRGELEQVKISVKVVSL